MDQRDNHAERELERLRQSYERLRDDRVRTAEHLRSLEQRLDELKAHARDEYGTDDAGELARLLEERRVANERAVAEYREHLETVQAELARTEQELG